MPRMSLEKISTREMIAELKRRKSQETALRRKHAALLKQLKSIEAQLGVAPRAAAKPAVKAAAPRRRARNKMTLPETMLKVMSKDKPMSVPQIGAACNKAGYVSVSKTFHTIIYQTLARDKRFKKAARGRYVIRSAA